MNRNKCRWYHHIIGFLILCLFCGACAEGKKDNKSKVEQDKTSSKSTPCVGQPNFNLIETLTLSAQKLEGTPYSVSKGTDCSGMFHKLLDEVRKQCPEAELPAFKVDRSSRDIAAWYYRNDRLQLIRDPDKNDDLIRPGVVMFYGQGMRSGIKYNRKKMTIDDLINTGTGVNHVGVVLAVQKEKGKVVSYDLFHGLNPKKPAAITREKYQNPNFPQHGFYSHWDQPWLAVADVLVD